MFYKCYASHATGLTFPIQMNEVCALQFILIEAPILDIWRFRNLETITFACQSI